MRIGATFEDSPRPVDQRQRRLSHRRELDRRQWFDVFLAAETVEKTYLGDVSEGDRVNLERALPADGRLDGHIVQGHVDTTTKSSVSSR